MQQDTVMPALKEKDMPTVNPYPTKPLEAPTRANDQWLPMVRTLEGLIREAWSDLLRDPWCDHAKIYYPRCVAALIDALTLPSTGGGIDSLPGSSSTRSPDYVRRTSEQWLLDWLVWRTVRSAHRRSYPTGFLGRRRVEEIQTPDNVGSAVLRMLRDAGRLDDLDPGPATEERILSWRERWLQGRR